MLCVDTGMTGHPDAGVPIWIIAPQTTASEKEYQLRRSGDGYVYKERTFEAKVARDGVVTFHNRKRFFDHVGLIQKPMPPGSQTESLKEVLFGHKVKHPQPVAPLSPLPRSPADKMEPWEICPQNSPCYALPDSLIVVGVNGTMDLTDEIMRALGQDPYRTEKAHFLAATFEIRMKLAVAAHREDMRKSLDRLPDALADLWGDYRYLARERRRVLFELWRETDGTPEGRRAANAIERFIQRQLPSGSPDAYTAAELKAYRESAPDRKFAPYHREN
jgi:hypothetical protein